MRSHLEVRVRGRVSQALAEEIGARFGEVTVLEERTSSVLSATVTDQAALRSLLALIWDTGGDLLSVTLDPGTSPRGTIVDACP